MKLLLLVAFCYLSTYTYSQAGDFILIQKNGRTVKSFFKGVQVRFADVGGRWYDARIEKITNDSVFFKEIIVQQVNSQFGVPWLKTMTTNLQKIYYHDIAAIPRKNESFVYVKNGTLFMLGGAGYATLNLVNSGQQQYAPFGKDNLPLLGAAAGSFAVGQVLRQTYKWYLPVGKRYKLKYVRG